MIKTFADKHTHQLYLTGTSKRLPADVIGVGFHGMDFSGQDFKMLIEAVLEGILYGYSS